MPVVVIDQVKRFATSVRGHMDHAGMEYFDRLIGSAE